MTTITNPQLKDTITHHFADQGEEAPSWVETHGLLCAFAVGPYQGPADFGEALEMPLPEAVAAALDELRARLLTDTLAGERITLPCLLDPYQEDDGNDLASWCAGFLSGVFLHEQQWFTEDDEDDTMANWLLPMILISGVDEDPELDEVWRDEKLVRQMGRGIPDVLEEILLHFQGPEG
ncbi:YecA family protein [Alloalcanivorax sp. C16-1]|uniref:YecA/YgfB family protein n=1 Tax=Alloalcanivorax sp. C16-1 TaxID=3390051 RepID=UPI003970CE85